MKIINAVDYGIMPNTDIKKKFLELIRNVSYIVEDKTIIIKKGRYDFFAEDSPKVYLRATNSFGESE